MEEVIRNFLSISSGYGDGYGSGYGSGYGDGDGYGYDSGYDSGIKQLNNKEVYLVDGVQTIINSVHGNYAEGEIVNTDLTTTKCYIAKVGDYFAHGETLKQALVDANQKALENEPIEYKVKRVVSEYPDVDKAIEHKTLFALHNVLTGSCEFGRRQFASSHNLDPLSGEMTMREFISLTKDAYGGEVIRLLAEEYGIKI